MKERKVFLTVLVAESLRNRIKTNCAAVAVPMKQALTEILEREFPAPLPDPSTPAAKRRRLTRAELDALKR